IGYLAGPSRGYARVDADYLRSRYSKPEFHRVTDDDRKAIAWLAPQVRRGERVLNSANDGSTFLYVERGIPVVNILSLGNPEVPATYKLLERFNQFPTDAEVRRMLRELNVHWIYV